MAVLTNDVFIARGKYATIASERRFELKKLREDMESLAGYASRIMRSINDMPFAQEQFEGAVTRVANARERLLSLAVLDAQLAELKPMAWGDKGEPE